MPDSPLQNPYSWHSQSFDHPHIHHPDTDRVMNRLLQGGVVEILGGHGMGKSVFLHQIEREFNNASNECQVVRFSNYASRGPLIETLAKRLKLNPGATLLEDVLDDWAETNPDRQLILLLDELDRLAAPSINPSESLQFMSGLEDWRQQNSPRLGLMGAGGLWLLDEGQHSLGSPWRQRSLSVRTHCFDHDKLLHLAKPLQDKYAPTGLSEDVLHTLKTLSGGIPLVAVYAMQCLWDQNSAPTSNSIAQIFRRFREDHRNFMRGVQNNLTRKRAQIDGPLKLYRFIATHQGPFSPSQLRDHSKNTALDQGNIDWEQSLELLIAAGLVNRTTREGQKPIACHAIPSVVALFIEEHTDITHTTTPTSLEERLVADLQATCQNIRRWGPDFYHGKNNARKIVEEGTFSAFLAVALAAKGWQVEREVIQGAGRTDLKLWFDEPTTHAILEVKLWGRNDYKEIHTQVTSYNTPDTKARAAIMLTTLKTERAQRYEEQCIPASRYEHLSASPNPEGVDHWCVREANLPDALCVHHFFVPVLSR